MAKKERMGRREVEVKLQKSSNLMNKIIFNKMSRENENINFWYLGNEAK